MQKIFYNPDNSLNLAGYAEMSRLLLAYCASARYPPWRLYERDTPPDAADKWRQGLVTAFADHLHAKVWIKKSAPADGSAVMRLYLSADEVQAEQLRRNPPFRHFWTLEVLDDSTHDQADYASRATPPSAAALKEVLVDEAGVNALLSRLGEHCIAPYTAADWQALQSEYGNSMSIVWSDMNHGPPSVALAWVRSKGVDAQEACVVLPSAWGTGPSDSRGFGNFGKDLEIDPHGMFAIFSVRRRYHFAQLAKPLQLPGARPMACAQVFQDTDYAYLRGSYGHLGIYEASHEPLQKDQHGDWVCNIMTHGNVLLNHPDHLTLAGSLSRGGCVVKSVLGVQRLVDWLPLQQSDCESQNWQTVSERARPRWATLQADNEGMRPVQHPQSLLWGWADSTDNAGIETRFSKVGQFHRGLASAAEPANVELQGLVNKAGAWMLPPQWRSISWDSPRLIVVQNAQNEWGAVGFRLDERGQAVGLATPVVPLQSDQAWLEIFDQQEGSGATPPQATSWGLPVVQTITEKITAAVEHAAKSRSREAVVQAKQMPSLASLAGVFDTASQTDLRRAGVWGMRVRVLHDQGGIFQIKAGEVGDICFDYPVTMRCYDLMQEAPVSGLPSAAHAAVGIAWGQLCFAPIAPNWPEHDTN